MTRRWPTPSFAMTRIHLALLKALVSGPLAVVALAQRLGGITGHDFGRQLNELVEGGLVRGPCGAFFQYELTCKGRAAAAHG